MIKSYDLVSCAGVAAWASNPSQTASGRSREFRHRIQRRRGDQRLHHRDRELRVGEKARSVLVGIPLEVHAVQERDDHPADLEELRAVVAWDQ